MEHDWYITSTKFIIRANNTQIRYSQSPRPLVLVLIAMSKLAQTAISELFTIESCCEVPVTCVLALTLAPKQGTLSWPGQKPMGLVPGPLSKQTHCAN